MPVPAPSAWQPPPTLVIWGLVYNFTNYTFKEKLDFLLNYFARGVTFKFFFEIQVVCWNYTWWNYSQITTWTLVHDICAIVIECQVVIGPGSVCRHRAFFVMWSAAGNCVCGVALWMVFGDRLRRAYWPASLRILYACPWSWRHELLIHKTSAVNFIVPKRCYPHHWEDQRRSRPGARCSSWIFIVCVYIYIYIYIFIMCIHIWSLSLSLHTHIYIYIIYIYIYIWARCSSWVETKARLGVFYDQPRQVAGLLSGWRNTVELVVFEISNSKKPYPSVSHAHTSELRPAIVCFWPKKLDEVSNRIPPTSQGVQVPDGLKLAHTRPIISWCAIHFWQRLWSRRAKASISNNFRKRAAGSGTLETFKCGQHISWHDSLTSRSYIIYGILYYL